MAEYPDNSADEEWRDIPGWEGLYQASSLGRIRRIRPSTQTKLDDGYMRVVLRDGKGRRKQASVHRLVCAAFNGPPPRSTSQSAHLNGVRDDNRPVNLVWATAKENNAHKIRHGTHNRGENHNFARLTEDQVREIRRLVSDGATGRSICARFGVTAWTIHDIAARRSWKHLE